MNYPADEDTDHNDENDDSEYPTMQEHASDLVIDVDSPTWKKLDEETRLCACAQSQRSRCTHRRRGAKPHLHG